MTENLYNKNGWSEKDIPVTVFGMDENSAFNDLIIRNSPEGDLTRIREEIEILMHHFAAEASDCGAIVLECQNLAPFGKTIQEMSGLPVFGINQLVAFIQSTVNYPNYS